MTRLEWIEKAENLLTRSLSAPTDEAAQLANLAGAILHFVEVKDKNLPSQGGW